MTTIIIPKLNKKSYDSLKAYQSIVLLNIISKLFEKVVSERLQFLSISNNFIHLCQLDGLKQRSTTDAGAALIHFICMDWVKNLTTSTLVLNIAQFFPSLNHQLLPSILDKVLWLKNLRVWSTSRTLYRIMLRTWTMDFNFYLSFHFIYLSFHLSSIFYA